jgi:hypothetical protein
MLLVQIFLTFFILLIIFNLISRLKRKDINVLNFSLWLIFWLAAILVIFQPELSTQVAKIFGVGRGADLIIYFSLILIFYFLFSFAIKIRKIENNIAKIVTAISLRNLDDRKDNNKV